ncbi:MAG TPA: FG-GAP-like repeat-containing protein [Bacteroidia bacterium]|nr:FG-GAP-like repeat-containing protein [Bacteroidia bacterium]HRH84283.1 FG-GAP-like repeat-containing protein [Bacteroidia bacterium]HRU17530.1 FG-GAP-like repeat-containing protein [Bacteroidia bacterium]
MKNKLYSKLGCLLLIAPAFSFAQLSFTNSNSRLASPAFHSGCPVSVVDWNNDGLDDIIRLDDGRDCYVDVHKTNQQYERIFLGSFSGGAWAMAVADLDKNGYKDVVAGGSFGSVQVLKTNNSGTGATLSSLNNSNFFLQNLTMADFDNDGWVDIFCCDDNAASHIYLNNGSGGFGAQSNIINFNLPNGSDNSGNYGSVWTDFDNDGDLDLYIAKCRQSVQNPTDPRRINVLFVNNGNGTFTENAAAYNINIGWQTWTAAFGDIDNDGDLDLMITNHDHNSQIFQNDGTGVYTDITASTGFTVSDITPIESVMEDFDNDGYVDIFVTGSDSRFWRNNGNGTFTKIEGLFNNNDMESFAIGDANHDGWIDVMASYAAIYTTPTSIDDVLWINNGSKQNIIDGIAGLSTNNFFNVVLEGNATNKDAIGARALIYGPWGVQLREVRAGESYGTNNSAILHFGLGTATAIDSMKVIWPSGVSQTVSNPSINQFLSVKENDCVSPEAIVTASGPLVLCTSGQTLTLTAPAGFNYLWSDSTTAQSITITQTGEYNVTISQPGNNCSATSATLVVIPSPDQTPAITALGETVFCNGGSVQIQGPVGFSSYLWSNGDTTQTATVTTNGPVTLTIQGICQSFTSDPINVTVNTVTDPAANDVTLSAAGSATLTATIGNNISWYATNAGGTPLATGQSYTTPFLTANTTYYMQATDTFGGGIYAVGLPTWSGAGSGYSGSTTNATTEFDVTKNCTLKSVKVFTNAAGIRRIELKDASSNVINYVDVNVSPDSQVVTLNFPLTPGMGYTLGTNTTTNQNNLGTTSPKFKRNSSGVNYPYSLSDALNITNSSNGGQYFYYFYDWQVEKESWLCESNMVPVNVYITTGISEHNNELLSTYPNPVSDQLHIYNPFGTTKATLLDITARVVNTYMLNNGENSFDIASLNAGVYHIQVENEGVITNLKFVKN